MTRLFERVFRKLQGNLDNTSDIPLETDILREDKKRELLYLTLRKFEDALDHLRQAEVLPGQLADQSPLVLQDVWEATLTDFFGRYYTLQLTNLEQPVVPTLMAEAEVVRRSILDRIPQVPMLLGHLLFQEPMVVDGGSYLATTPQAQARSQALIENLLIQVANAVIQPLLNCFADVELMKKNLYHRRIMTSRDIERFRNDLSWRYRWDGLINEPRAIFESEHSLLGFTERGIQRQSIYAPAATNSIICRGFSALSPSPSKPAMPSPPLSVGGFPGGQQYRLCANGCDWARYWSDWARHFTRRGQCLARSARSSVWGRLWPQGRL